MATRSNNHKKRAAKGTSRKTKGAVKKPQVAKDFSFKPKTQLGKDLWAIRSAAVAAGMKLLNSEELRREILSRRSGYFTDDE